MNIPWLIGKKLQQYFYNIKSSVRSVQVASPISTQQQICSSCQQPIPPANADKSSNKRKASHMDGATTESPSSNKKEVKKTSSKNKENKASKNKASKKKSSGKKSSKTKITKKPQITKAKSNKPKKHKKHHRMESTAEEIELEEAFSLEEAQQEENEMGESDTDDFIDDDEDDDSTLQDSELDLIPANERRGVKIVEKLEAKADEDYLPYSGSDNSDDSFETSEYSSDISISTPPTPKEIKSNTK